MLSNTLAVSSNKTVEDNLKKLTKQVKELNLRIERMKNKDLDDIIIETIKTYMSYILGDKIEDNDEFRRRLAKHFIKYVIMYPSKIIVGLRGYSPKLPDFELEPDFENIDKCLISQDRRRSSNKRTNGSPI